MNLPSKTDRDIQLYAEGRVVVDDIPDLVGEFASMAQEIRSWRARYRGVQASAPVDIPTVIKEFRKVLKLPTAKEVADRRKHWLASGEDLNATLQLVDEALSRAEATLLDDPSKDPMGTRRKAPDNREVIKTDQGDWLLYADPDKTATQLTYKDADVKGWTKL